MKVAIYHNLPSGGAKRALGEIIKRTGDLYEYDLYTLQSDDDFFKFTKGLQDTRSYKYAKKEKSSNSVASIFHRLNDRKRIVAIQRMIAREIDSKNYDFVLVGSCSVEHNPSILRFLKTKKVYYMQEPRRASFEYSLSPYPQGQSRNPLQRVKKLVSHNMNEAPLRRQDIIAARSADLVLCNSLFSLESIARAYGVYAELCYLGVDADSFVLSRTKDKEGILGVGALHPNKGHELVINALAKVPEIYREYTIIYDRGLKGYEGELIQSAAKNRVRLCLKQRVKDSELVSLYGKVRLVVCAAELEPFGFTPLESIACGTPVVAIKEGGYRETVNAEVGSYAQRSIDSLAESIMRELSITRRPESLRSYIEKSWSWDSTVERYLELTKRFSAP